MEPYSVYGFVSGFFASAGVGSSGTCLHLFLSPGKNFPRMTATSGLPSLPWTHIWVVPPFFPVMDKAAMSLITSLFVDEHFSFIWGLLSLSGIAEFKEWVYACGLNTFKLV